MTGFPPPKITWRKVHDNLIQSRVFVKDGQFSIITVQKKDSGLYKCQASNHLGYDFAVTQLNVIELPYFTVRPPAQFETGKTLRKSLNCQAAGHPKPTVTWLKVNSQLPIGRSMVSGNGTLMIWDSKEGDSGTYNCVASSGKFFRKAIASVKLTVKKGKVNSLQIAFKITLALN